MGNHRLRLTRSNDEGQIGIEEYEDYARAVKVFDASKRTGDYVEVSLVDAVDESVLMHWRRGR